MKSNKLRMAIRATAALTVLGLAGQAQAFEVEAGDVKADIYGYAQLTAAYDINEDIGSANTLAGTFSSINGSDNEGHFDMGARQSRIGVKTTLPQDVNVVVEGDFFGSASGGFRLRHAYGEYNGFLAGQTWSNYNSFTGNTSIIDFNAAAGWAGYQARASQLRYTTGGLSVALEDPQSRGTTEGGALDGTTAEKDGMPAFSARYEGSADALSFAAAGLVKQAAYDDGAGNDDSVMTYAVFGAAKFKISDMVSVQGSLNYTDGANGYLYLSGGPDGYIDANGDIETLAGYGGSIGASIGLGGGRSVNISYGMTTLDWDDDAAFQGNTESNSNVFANYMWTPVQNVLLGVEYGYWKTETKGGDSEDANRLLFAARYSF